MKRSIKLVVCMLLVATIALPSVFATGLGTSSSIVKVGIVDDTDVNYDIDIEWGSLVYDFVKVEDEHGDEYYDWEPESEMADYITITNKSNVIVKADVNFTSAIPTVIGFMDDSRSGLWGGEYKLLSEEPEDFSTGTYFELNENGMLVEISENTVFEADKYYEWYAAGGAPYPSSGEIPAMYAYDDILSITGITYVLKLEGGSLSNVRPGATIGTVTVTLS